MSDDIDKLQDQFIEWADEKCSVKVLFIDGNLIVPVGQGKSVNVIMQASWDALLSSHKKQARPAPCYHACESQAFKIEIRQLAGERDRLQVTVGEMAAEIERLNAVPAQQSVDRDTIINVLLSIGNMSEGIIADAIISAIGAQQSPIIPNGVYENKCSCGSFFFGVKNQPFCAKCYDEKLKAQQSPAVAVPDGDDGLLPIGSHDHPDCRVMYWSEQELRAIKDYAKRCIAAQGQSPRITEQDNKLAALVVQELYNNGGAHESQMDEARRIIRFIAPHLQDRVTEQDAREIGRSMFLSTGYVNGRDYVERWLSSAEGCALLNKLNDKPESVGG